MVLTTMLVFSHLSIFITKKLSIFILKADGSYEKKFLIINPFFFFVTKNLVTGSSSKL